MEKTGEHDAAFMILSEIWDASQVNAVATGPTICPATNLRFAGRAQAPGLFLLLPGTQSERPEPTMDENPETAPCKTKGLAPSSYSSGLPVMRAKRAMASVDSRLLEISEDFLKSVEWGTSHPSYVQARKGAEDCS
jgi:hypothetical protein